MKAIPALKDAYGAHSYTDATLSGLRASMAAAGVAHAVVVPIATTPAQVPAITDWAAASRAPDLTLFGSIHPDTRDPAAAVARMREIGLRGAKFHAESQQCAPDDQRMFPIYAALRDAGMIAFFHAGNEIKALPAVGATPGRIARVLAAFPGLTVIAAHMGGYLQWDEAREFLVGREVYFDTSFCLHKLGPQRFMDLLRAHGAQRVLFGSDSPWGDQSAAVREISALPLTDDERRLVFHDNAARLMGLNV